jgi:hypothetical protein
MAATHSSGRVIATLNAKLFSCVQPYLDANGTYGDRLVTSCELIHTKGE